MNLVPMISYGPPLSINTKQVPTYQVYDITGMKMWHHVRKYEKSRKLPNISAIFSTFFTQNVYLLYKMGDNVKLYDSNDN